MAILKNTVYENWYYKNFYKYAVYKFLFCKRFQTQNTVEYLLVHNHWSRGYHHWVVESLVRALSVDQQRRKDLVLLLPENYLQFAHESIELLGFNDVQLIPDRECLKVKNVTIPPNPMYQEFDRGDMDMVREFYYEKYDIKVAEEPQLKVYVSRQGASMRRIMNEEKVIELMKSYGFLILKAEELSFREQVVLFSKTKYFVSIHGAALTNMVFMKKNTTVLEFFRAIEEGDPPKTFCFDKLASATDVTFDTLYFPHDRNYKFYPDRADITVNLDRLGKWLENNIT